VVTGVTVPRPVAEELMAHARSELPNEACGLLAGSLASGRACTYHPARNAEASPLRYSVHPEDLVRITFAIEEAGKELVAIFHSHTHSSAVPSATDRRASMYPDQFYVIATLADPEAPPDRVLRSWRIIRGHSFEVPLTIG
jgi:proteasome lid subunit RPN8/RPN11